MRKMYTYSNEQICIKMDPWNSWWNVLPSNTDSFYSYFIFSNSLVIFQKEIWGKSIIYWYTEQEECADAISFPEII